MSLFCLISFAGTETIQLTLGEEEVTGGWKYKTITDAKDKIKEGDEVVINFGSATSGDYAICNKSGTKIVKGAGTSTGSYNDQHEYYSFSGSSEIKFTVSSSIYAAIQYGGMRVEYDYNKCTAASASISRFTYDDVTGLTDMQLGTATKISDSWNYQIVEGATYLLNDCDKIIFNFANTTGSEQFAICDAEGNKIYGGGIANTSYNSEYQCYTVNSGTSSIKFEVDAALLATIQKKGLRIEFSGLNNISVTKEAYQPETIADEVTARFNAAQDKRASWTVGKRMSNDGYANIVWYDGSLKYESSYIVNGGSYTIPASAFTEVQPGDILHVFVENCAELNYHETTKYKDYNDKEVSDGHTGSWAGLRVGDGWLAPKMNCFAIKGDFVKVLDFHMVDLIKAQGLRIEGCKFQLDYVCITKGEMAIKTEENTGRPRIETKVNLSKDGDGKWKWTIDNLVATKIYWGDVLYVEYDKAGDAPTTTISGSNIINGNTITELRGDFFNSNSRKNRYFLPLDYKDAQILLNLETKPEDAYLEIKAPAGVNITAVKILPEVRERNKQEINVENVGLDWNDPDKQLDVIIGQVEIGDKVKVTTEGGSHPEFQASVMHRGDKNTKALAFNELFKFADIYDVLTYSNNSETAREYFDYNPGTFEYEVKSQYMANQFAKFPLTLNGQDVTVTKVEVDSKAFVFPAEIGLDGKPVYWGTMCCPYNISVPEDGSTHAWIVTGVDTENPKDNIYPINVTEVHHIPAGTPVLISKDENVYGEKKDEFRFTITDDKDKFECDDIFKSDNGNMLIGDMLGDMTLKNDADYTYYKLTYKNSKLDGTGDNITGFFKIADAGIQTAQFKTYLKVANGIAPKAKAFVFKFDNSDFNTPTGIESIETPAVQTEKVYYNLNGQRIGKPTKSGIYICNGKKVIIK